MATTLKVLGQTAPSATTETALYPSAANTGTTVVVSTITVANRASTAATFRIAITVNGQGGLPSSPATANKEYIAYDTSINGNETIAYTLGLTLGDNDEIRVYASTANLSFGAFGQENT